MQIKEGCMICQKLKGFTDIPKFRPIIDAIGTSHCLVEKYSANLLKPLIINDFSIKYSFVATSRIKDIPQDLLHNGDQFSSFDLESLFKNMLIKRTADIILKWIPM